MFFFPALKISLNNPVVLMSEMLEKKHKTLNCASGQINPPFLTTRSTAQVAFQNLTLDSLNFCTKMRVSQINTSKI
jgi:hypothetical protein